MKSAFVILLFFCGGVLAGLAHIVPTSVSMDAVSFFALCVLMFCVGVTVGSDRGMLRRFRSLNPHLVLLPVFTVLGSLAGSLAVSALLSYRVTDVLAIGSGLGYYSLSSVLITDMRGADLGTVALLANISREVITLLLAPLMVRFFGVLAPISSGGATTADTTLPVIVRVSGSRYTVLSIYHGCVVDFSVPFLVTFFCSFPV